MKRLKLTVLFLCISFIILIIKYLSSSSILKYSEERRINLALSIDKAVEYCLKEYDINEKWIRRNVIQHTDNNIRKNIKWIRIPEDLPLPVLNLAIAKAVIDSGGRIIEGKEITRRNRLIITAGYDNIVVDSLILTKDKDLTYKKGKIAIIIDDFGGDNGKIVEEYLEFPEIITFSIIPGNKYSKEIGESASKRGYEVMVHLPMESKTSPKKNEKILLKDKMSRRDVERIINMSMDELPMAEGLSNHMGSKATENATLMKYLAEVLKRKKLYFIDCLTSTKSRAFDVFRKSKIRVLKRDVFLDNEENEELILAQLDELMRIAKKNGKAIGIGHATKDITRRVLRKEMPEIYKKGYEFVSASEILTK
ncbi:MAG: divergent polysaccharide deacetylase family protein [Candidatus Helarchaeota archaeon]|nr:divergent polysaccharide deacetylase family protein [Candidatus Helarchaeota archaeon]